MRETLPGCARLLAAFVLLHSSFVIAAEPPEPPRKELWLPSDKLDSFLQKNPKAVLLSTAEYEVLIRDAGKTEPPRDPKLEPPKKLIIESLHLTGTAEPGATTLQLSGTLTVHVPADGWAQESLAWPYYFQISQMQTLTGGPLLAWLSNEEFKADQVPAETMRRLNLAVRGAGKRELRFTGTLPLYYRLFSGERGLDLQHIGCAGRVTLTLPEGAELLPGSAAQQSGRTVTAAFDHRFIRRTDNGDPLTSVPFEKKTAGATLPDAVRLRWTDPQRDAGVSPLRFVENSGRVTLEVSDARLRTRLEFTADARAGQNGRHESDWPILGGEGTQVTSVKGDDVLAWRQDAGVLHVTLAQSTAAAPVEVMLERPLTLTVATTEVLPLLRLPLTLTAELRTAEGVDLLALDGLRDSRVQLDAAAAPQITLRPAQARLEADVDTAAKLDRDSLRIDRTLNLRSDRPVSSVTLVLPEGEEFIAIMEPKAPGVDPVLGNAPVLNGASISNVAVFNSARQEITQSGVLNVAAAQAAPLVVQTESSRLITSNVITQPVVSVRPQPFTWRRAGNTITLLFTQLISPSYSPKLFVVSRQKLAKAWSGPKNPETLTLAHLGIPEAVKVAGYTALDFDDSWRVALKSANGLEDRDARLTPVKGRMAWFGLREHALTFEVERAEAVFSAEVTAYALPRARSVEIEGQFTLMISGAPLRRFQVQLPKESAKLLRVTSPLIGEQQLDEATGIWTLTLRQEAKGRQNIRWRMSLVSEAQANDTQTSTATLPRLQIPAARRFEGSWVIEANTDTQLSTQTQGMQPLDVLKAPVVEAYAPRHRITSAFSFGVAEHALTLTARRHAHSELAPLVITHLRLTSVLDAHGPALHEARLTLLHTGEQFIPLTLPPGAALLSTLANGEAVKPVRTSGEAVAVPLPAASANMPTTITLQYRLQHNAWAAKGELDVPPVRFASGVPVLETEWLLHTPKTFSITDPDTTLESLDVKEVPNVVQSSLRSLSEVFGSLLDAPDGSFAKKVDFLPGGAPGAPPTDRGIRRELAIAPENTETLGSLDASWKNNAPANVGQHDGMERKPDSRAGAAQWADMAQPAPVADPFAAPGSLPPPPPGKANLLGDAPAAGGGFVTLNEPVISRGRSGLLPLTVEMPSEGRVLRFAGLQPPPVLHLRYQSWEHQMRWAVLAMLGGMVAFALLAWRRRPWMKTALIVVLAALAFPLLLEGQSLALANAVAFGWVVLFVVRVLASLIQRLPQPVSTLDGEEVAA